MSTETTNAFTVMAKQSGETIKLAMESLFVTGKIIPIGAKLIVEHKFVCGEKNPTEVVYSFGLPRNATLRRFKVKSENFVVESELKEREEVKKIYEEAIAEGHLAVQAQRYRDGIVNLTVGNILPQEEVKVYLEILAGVDMLDDGFRFRFPFTLAPCYHSLARVSEVEPGTGEIELPEGKFGDVFLPIYRKNPNDLHTVGFNIAIEMPEGLSEVSSPSHPIKITNVKPNNAYVALSTEKAPPNRDLVIDVRMRKTIMCAACEKGSTGTFHFYAFYPSTVFEKSNNNNAVANVVIVIDRSGSMEGTPLEQAKRAAKACLSALDKDDRFTVIAFDNSIEVFSERLVEANKNNIFNAFTFIESRYARGGTELGMAIRKAQDVLISSKIDEGNIFVITDGQVYATEDIIRIAKRKNIRHHCLGIGSASQDRFINLLASETGGSSVFLTPQERIEEEALKLFNSIKMHLGKITNYKFNGCQNIKAEPDFSRFILSGRPVVIFGETSELPNGELKINISQNGRSIVKTLPFKPVLDTNENFIKLLRGARIIDSIESQIGSFEDKTPKASKLLKKLTNESKKYGLASRTMGLVAVIKRKNNKNLNLPTTRVVPVGMPEDVEWGAYFGRVFETRHTILACPPSPIRFYNMRLEIIKDIVEESKTTEDLFELVSQIEPDGGLPGIDEEDRIKKTILALFRILDDKSNINRAVFRLHIRKMVRFLKQYEHKYPLISRIINITEAHIPVPAGWEEIETGDLFWKQLETILVI